MASVETLCVAKEGSGIIKINKEDLAVWKEKGYAECNAPKGETPVMRSEGKDDKDEGITAEMTKNEIATALEDEKYAEIADKVDLTETKANIVAQIELLMAPADDE